MKFFFSNLEDKDVVKVLGSCRRYFEPFSSSTFLQYSVSYVKNNKGKYEFVAQVKGGFEAVMQMCSKMMETSKKGRNLVNVHKIVKRDRERLSQAHKSFVDSGETVMAIARKTLDKEWFGANHDFYDIKAAMEQRTHLPREHFVFVGLVSYSQTPAESSNQSVKTLKQRAGVKLVMVTS